jgi:hypothetical protein
VKDGLGIVDEILRWEVEALITEWGRRCPWRVRWVRHGLFNHRRDKPSFLHGRLRYRREGWAGVAEETRDSDVEDFESESK